MVSSGVGVNKERDGVEPSGCLGSGCNYTDDRIDDFKTHLALWPAVMAFDAVRSHHFARYPQPGQSAILDSAV